MNYRMMRKLYLSLILIACAISTRSQIVHETGSPMGFDYSDKSIEWVYLSIHPSEIDQIRSEARGDKGLLRFAIPAELNLNPANSGIITQQKGEFNTWHIFISSDDAAALGVIFSKFKLVEGEKIFIYDPGQLNILGPFTYKNNKECGILPVIPLEGSQLIIEYSFRKEGGGDLEIGQLSHDALGIFGKLSEKDVDYGSSGICNIDINCDEGLAWGNEKRAVVKLLINNTYLGTGTMVNNTAYDNIPYILTAQHVVGNSFEANQTIAIFNYESPWCDGPDGRVSKSISGADLVSSNDIIDVTLLELSEFPPILYKPYMAGWDVSGNITPYQTCIHHPSGDVKKISVDLDEPIIATFENKYEDGFWQILQWDYGTTEGGSSGSPLFNNNHKIIGTLTGGEARCGNSVNDYYARLDISFDISVNSLYSLKPWLDNNNIGTEMLSGRDPYENNYQSSDTLFNGVSGEYFLTEYYEGSTGLSTGINIDSLISYAEKFYTDSPKEITDVFLFLGSTNYVTSDDSVSIYILDDNSGPGNVIASEKVFIKETTDDYLLRVDFSNPVFVNGTFYVAYRNWYRESADSEIRQFAVYHGSASLPGSDFAWYMDQNGWHPFSQHPFDPGENTLYIKTVVVENSTAVSVQNEYLEPYDIKIYPNPISNILIIESLSGEKMIQSAAILDITGKTLRKYSNINSYHFSIDNMQNMKAGIYFIEVVVSGQSQVYKIIKGGVR